MEEAKLAGTDSQTAFGVPVSRYQVRLPGFDFEGPLDLLLQVIERNELPITQISLASIADEYTGYIERLSEVNPAELVEFLAIAAKLLLIKSSAILPSQSRQTNEAEEEITDAEELLAQLREYKRIRDVAAVLAKRQESGQHSYTTQRTGPSELVLQQVNAILTANGSFNSSGLKLSELLAPVRRRLAAQQQQQMKLPVAASAEDLGRLVRTIRIEDKIALIDQHLNNESSVAFSTLFDPAEPPSDLEVIISFMAVLEMLRTHRANAYQDALFGDIYITR